MPAIIDPLAAFLRRRIFGTKPRADAPRIEEAAILRRAERARELLRSEVFIEAYQDELDSIVDGILTSNTDTVDGRRQALASVVRARELQNIVAQLNGYVNQAAVIEARRSRDLT